MISVKCPACGLVDWNVGNCKRCETPLAGLSADDDGQGYSPGVSEWAAQARTVRTARLVMAVCAVVVLGLTALCALYLVHKPTKQQWFWSFYRHEPTVAEIFAHNLKVCGGAERLADLRSFKATGRMVFSGEAAEKLATRTPGEVSFVMQVKAPNLVTSEIEFGAAEADDLADPSVPVGLVLRRGFDGERGWEYAESTFLPFGATAPVKRHSTRELGGAELEQMKHYAKTTGFFRRAEEYDSLKLTGREAVTWEVIEAQKPGGRAVRGREAYVVTGVNAQGRNETFYFDTLTGLLLRVDFEAEDAEGEAVNVACYLGDYREVGGLKLPHRLDFKHGEEAATLNFEQYFPNDPVPDSMFEMPD